MNNWYLAGGDFGFNWPEQIRALSWLPQVFRPDMELGRSRLDVMWFAYPYTLIIKILDAIGLSWWGIEKLLWLSVLCVGVYSSYRLASYIFKSRISSYLSSIIYMTNTYVLLLLGGRQLGVALAYGLSPLVLLKFIQYIDQSYELRVTSYPPVIFREAMRVGDLRKIVSNGLLFALLVCFDIRLAYLIIGAVLLYYGYRIASYGFKKNNPQSAIRHIISSITLSFFVPLCIAAALHLFWILPIVMVRGGFSLSQDFTNTGMLKFLSVADFSHALSLLHPNWPENLFGKVYFLQPEFLILPILALGGLLFTHYQIANDGLRITPLYQSNKGQIHDELKKKNNTLSAIRNQTSFLIMYFALLVLLGTFLAKGANPPFGGVYIWLFEHIPGFVMLRDPTKFYLYIAIGYSVLIPFTLYSLAYSELRITNWYKKSIRYPLSVIIVLIFAAYWLFTLRALFTGQAAGNFRPLLLTHEYQKLHDLLVNDNKSSRILWIPSADKFMYGSVIHPVLFADTLWKNASSGALLNASGTPEFFNTLQNAGVRYIIVPKDLEKRIFLSDYRFDNNQREALIHALDQTGLRKLPEFQELAVYENPTYEFQLVVPDYVEKQKYWAIIGAYLSACTLVVTIGSMFIVFRKFNYL